MARNNQYPIILGMNPPNKQGIGIKSKLGSGYDLYILDEDMTHQYAQLHFCNIEAVDRMINLLQRMKELWEREESSMNEKTEWKTIKDDGLPPVGSCLIVTIKNHGYGGRRELRYPVHYLQKNYAPGYAFYMNGTDILLPEYSEVVAWMNVTMTYDGEEI